MKKRILSLAISAALVLTMLPAGALAAGDKGTPPVYNKATGCYEISTPDQRSICPAAGRTALLATDTMF